MPRHSNHGKDLTPATIIDSDDDFVAVASNSNDQYVIFYFIFYFIFLLNHCLYIVDLYFIFGSADRKNVDSESDAIQETNKDEGDHGHKINVKVTSKKKAIEVHDSDSKNV